MWCRIVALATILARCVNLGYGLFSNCVDSVPGVFLVDALDNGYSSGTSA